MTAPETVSRRPTVSVIVPARNEEASLGSCLESLTAQTGVSSEIILVDDASTDRTREIAQSFPSVRVVDAGPPPAHWTGKNNAMVAGAKVAAGEWLLFTDADTFHLPGSLARAVAEASRLGASLLSYSPEQEVHGFWQKAVMPVIFAELAATYRPALVSDPAVAGGRGQRSIHPDCARGLRRHRWTRGGERQPARRRGAGQGCESIGPQDFLSLWRRCRPHPHVSQLFATARRLDQKSGPAVCLSRAPCPAAADGVCADCWRRRRSGCGFPARPHHAGSNGGAFSGCDVRFSPESNPQGTFFLDGNCFVSGRPSPLCVSFVALQTLS